MLEVTIKRKISSCQLIWKIKMNHGPTRGVRRDMINIYCYLSYIQINYPFQVKAFPEIIKTVSRWEISVNLFHKLCERKCLLLIEINAVMKVFSLHIRKLSLRLFLTVTHREGMGIFSVTNQGFLTCKEYRKLIEHSKIF